jgi:protein-S-isoprenylcysteine O-methyltransferase Ste14
MSEHAAEHAKAQDNSNFALWISIAGIASLLLVGGYRAAVATGVFQWTQSAMIVLYIIWIASEFRVTSSSASQDRSKDQYTCETYAIARFVTMLAALGFDPIWPNTAGAWVTAGFAVFFCGVALRAWAIHTLGQGYSHRVRKPTPDGIITSGPYRFVRHPAYSGMLLAHAGVLILFCNIFSVVALFAVFVPALVRRIHVEERELLAIPDYCAFAATRARLLPGIW